MVNSVILLTIQKSSVQSLIWWRPSFVQILKMKDFVTVDQNVDLLMVRSNWDQRQISSKLLYVWNGNEVHVNKVNNVDLLTVNMNWESYQSTNIKGPETDEIIINKTDVVIITNRIIKGNNVKEIITMVMVSSKINLTNIRSIRMRINRT